MTISRQLRDVFSTGRFQERVKEFLVCAPELKHEGAITTQLRIGLSLGGNPSRREVTAQGFRHDLRIAADTFVEAKYHYEGDVERIVDSLRWAISDPGHRTKILDRGARKTAERDMIVQAVRDQGAHWLLWMVLVRPPGKSNDYCFPNLIREFYRGQSNSLKEGVVRARAQMLEAAGAFSALRGHVAPHWWMPKVETDRGTLLTLLVRLRAQS